MLGVVRLFHVLGMIIVSAMSSFGGGILMKPFDIVGECNIGLHKFPALGNTLILVLVRSRCMFVTLLDPCGNVVGDQFYQRIG